MKILLIDPHHELLRDGLRFVLQKLSSGVGMLLEAGNWEDGLKCIEQHPDLDLILLASKAPGCRGADSVNILHKCYPHISVVVMCEDAESHVIDKVLSYGARGVIGKSSSVLTLLRALESVFAGNIYVSQQLFKQRTNQKPCHLTQRQMQILDCLMENLSNKEIAERLGIVEGTVKIHVAAVCQALLVKNRKEAVIIARKTGLGTSLSDENPQGVSRLYGRSADNDSITRLH